MGIGTPGAAADTTEELRMSLNSGNIRGRHTERKSIRLHDQRKVRRSNLY